MLSRRVPLWHTAGMAMRATTVRFTGDLWGLLESEAAAEGVSAAQFVRDAAILRLAHLAAERGEPETRLSIEQVASGALRRAPDPAPAPVLQAVRDRRRLAGLQATGALSGQRRPALDRIASVAARVLNTPVSFVTLVDEDQQVFAGCVGLTKEPWATARATPLTHSFCQHAVASREPLIVDDARDHPLLKDNLAIRDLNVVAYAGIPLIDSTGQALGTLCTIDDHPRVWTRHQVALLKDIAASVMREIELTRAASA
jgi:GAF domain-containing protein